MKHLIRAIIALGTVLCVGASAQPACEPAAPADFEGTLKVMAPGPSFAAAYFENAGCNWNGADLNGTDAVVFDVERMVGTGTISGWAYRGTPPSLIVVGLSAYFLDGDCARVGESMSFGTSSGNEDTDAYTLNFPEGGKWLVVVKGQAEYPTNEMSVSVHYDGRDCVVDEPEKKKNKKKKNKKKKRG